MRKILSMVVVVGLAACHRGPPPEVEPYPQRLIGDYSYRIMGGPVSLVGRFTIQPDTVTMEARTHACRRVEAAFSHPAVHMFRCGGGSTAINVRLDSSSPGMSTWNAMVPGQKEVNVCAKYVWNEKDEPYCVATRKEVRTEMVRVGGILDVTRVASAEKP